jgi:hypothetical protein
MNIFKFLLPLLYLFLTNEISAQYILSQQVLSNSGGNVNMAGITMDYTAGEAFTSKIDNGSYSISQGFHQYFTSTISTEKIENNLFKFYPNPVTGICYLKFEKRVSGSSTLQIYNSVGIIIYKQYFNNTDVIQLDLSHLIPGNYIAVLKDSKKQDISSFNLIKI